MADPLFTHAEAHARANELLAAFERNPDVLSPDEQALVMMIRNERFLQQQHEQLLRDDPEYARRWLEGLQQIAARIDADIAIKIYGDSK